MIFSNVYFIVMFLSAFAIFFAMIGYPISLKIFDKLLKPDEHIRKENQDKTVTVLVVAHNEEKVILEKLRNISEVDYPRDKIYCFFR